MSLEAKRSLVGRWRSEYACACKKEKSRILDALCEATNWNRNYAVGALKGLPLEKPKQRRSRSRVYGPNEEAALVKVWRLSGFLSSKRLAPFLGEFLNVLERHEELRLPEPTRSRLAGMSSATVDRLLARHRSSHHRAQSLTRPGALLKKHIKIRTGMDWDDSRPGFCEVDTVAHCGGSMEGQFFWTLTLTDVATQWTECVPLRNKGQEQAVLKLRGIQSRLPFVLLGLDSDNGCEFINYHVLKFCQDNKVQFTRCRPYHKNDQCHVEQKNGAIVRKHAGYGRFETDKQFALLSNLYATLRLLVNFFEPSIKRKAKGKAQTPYSRLLESELLDTQHTQQLREQYELLNPINLREELTRTKMELLELEAMVSFLDDADV